jgi:cell wall-associated NlpC family hydrolase
MRRRGPVFVCALVALVLVPASSAKPSTSWALPQIKAVVAAGVMGSDVATFHPNDPLTRVALEQLVAGLTRTVPVVTANPTARVTMSGLDSRLVSALGLSQTARLFQDGARSAGLKPPSRFGTEEVARLLGLRTNHPAAQDDLERLPSETATRAEAAYSGAQILAFTGTEVPLLSDAAATFVSPLLTPWQQRILTTAVRFIGYPYVWGGESETVESPFGVQAQGGFDCSGFVWRVYKLQRYPDEGTLASTLKGRTTYTMSGEVPAARRIPFAKLQPADVIFFGARGPKSKSSQVGHMGIYLGNGWFIQSSEDGVDVAPLAGWYRTKFAWARRPLAEAGLSGSAAPPATGWPRRRITGRWRRL